jgi:tRNA1(Val) A37 N6-methylase TrmN6
VHPGEHLAYLAGDWRILQRRDGHSWSLDDLVVAWVAQAAVPEPTRVLDLGTGIGAVLFLLAWRFPDAHLTGIEAQALSHALSLRTAHYNGVEARVNLVHNDFRHAPLPLASDTAPDLVTGTPPYFDNPDQPRSDHVQRGPCRFEDRGGIDAYLTVMARVLAVAPAHARAVVCHASRQRARVLAAIAASALATIRQLAVIPKAGKDALIDVFTLARTPPIGAAAPAWETLVVRDPQDQWTPAFRSLRQTMGLPSEPPRPPAPPGPT